MPPFFGFASEPGNITDRMGALAGKCSLSLTVWGALAGNILAVQDYPGIHIPVAVTLTLTVAVRQDVLQSGRENTCLPVAGKG
eukprot:1957539-Prorocentrum_lima.AAC.1